MPTGARTRPVPVRRRKTARGIWRAAAAAGLAAVLVSACATVPDSGSAQAGKAALTAGGQGQDFLQLIAVPPKPGWSPKQIVAGFLAACASFANSHAIAREYLDPTVRDSWAPRRAVTVVGAGLKVGQAHTFPHIAGAANNQTDKVKAAGEKVATLSDTGQYRGTTGSGSDPFKRATTSSSYQFKLYKIDGQWRINNPPDQLLITKADFQRVYAPRNLYYVASRAHVLVPDPVFVPLQATSSELAVKLVTALLRNPEGWLAHGVITAFPRGAKLLRVAINDGVATIDLGGSAASATQPQLSAMTSQLVSTLAGPSYGQSAIQSVQLEINGHTRGSASASGGRSGLSVPREPADAPLYSVTAGGAVQRRTASDPVAHSVPGEAGEGRVPMTSIAVSPRGSYVAGVSRSRKIVYYGAMRPGAGLASWRPYGGSVTSLSWDVGGELWVAASNGVWLLVPGDNGKMKPAPAPGLGLPNHSVVSQLRVAPDGVRVAMIVHGPLGQGSGLLLAAITRGPNDNVTLGPLVPIGTDLHDPTQLTWYDANNLIALSRSKTPLQEVAVNGGSSSALVPDPGTQSVTAAGPANPVVVGLAHGQMAQESSLNGTWASRGGASSPVYPG